MYTQRYRTDQSFGHLTVEVKLMARSIPPNTSTCNEDMFDKVLFLACGHLVYNGPPSGLKKWLTESNLWDPERAMTTFHYRHGHKMAFSWKFRVHLA